MFYFIRSLLSDIATAHGGRLANELPPLNIEQPETNLFTTSTIDISELVHLRFLHQTKLCFDIIPSILFLCALQKSPIIPRNGQPGLEVSHWQEDADLFKVLCKRHQDIVKAVKTFNKHKKSTQNDIVDEDLDDEGE